MSEPRTSADKAQDYTAMGHSVDLITAIIGGTQDADQSAADRQDRVDRPLLILPLPQVKHILPLKLEEKERPSNY